MILPNPTVGQVLELKISRLEARIAELEAALRDCTITFHILLTDNSGADMKGLIAETKLSARKALEARDGQE